MKTLIWKKMAGAGTALAAAALLAACSSSSSSSSTTGTTSGSSSASTSASVRGPTHARPMRRGLAQQTVAKLEATT